MKKYLMIIILIISLISGGCAGLASGVAYHDSKEKLQELIYSENDVALARISFNGNLYFMSLGVVAPVVPVYVNPFNKNKLELSLDFNMYKNQYFSVPANLCLAIDNEDVLCPESVNVYAVALRDIGSIDPDRHNYTKIRNFINNEDININLEDKTGGLKIDKDYVLNHYEYSKQDNIDFLRVQYTFKYKCANKCPKRITINPNKMVYIDGLSIEDKDIIFERKVSTGGGFLWQ